MTGRALAAAALALACAGGTALGSEPASPPAEWGPIPHALVVPDTLGSAVPFGPAESWAPPPPARPDLPNELPFGPGERLEFSIDYGFINAGGATMVVERTRNVSGRECLDIRTEAKSNSVFSKIYKVWDRAQTFLEVDTLLPRRFEKHLREGSYKKDAVVKFDREGHFARYENGDELVIHPWAQDELSAFYYVRMLPLEVGREVLIDNHANRKNYPLKVIVHRRETVEVGAGKFDCLVIEPVIREGGIFSAKGTLTIWITDDARRMPVKMTTKVVVGSISATLTKFRLGAPVARKAS